MAIRYKDTEELLKALNISGTERIPISGTEYTTPGQIYEQMSALHESHEIERDAAEQDRIASENKRISAETARVTSETQRTKAENLRASAETKRQTNTATAIDLTNSAAASATNAAAATNQKTQEANVTIIRLEELEVSLVGQYKMIPTGMNLKYIERVTFGNTTPLRINYEILPVNTGRNVLFLGDNNAVSVMPNGEFTLRNPGISTIHVIPTENTNICQTIQITVVEPDLRKVGPSLRLMANGNLRLT